MAKRLGALVYLRQELGSGVGFLKEWQALSKADQDTLRQWAEEEMTALGMTEA